MRCVVALCFVVCAVLAPSNLRAELDKAEHVGVLVGDVQSASGAPVEGAIVEILPLPVLPYHTSAEIAVGAGRAFRVPPAPAVQATVRTGPQGVWRFDRLDPATRFLVRARGERGSVSDPVIRRPRHRWTQVRLHLRPALPVPVRVVDHLGAPIAGATVTVRSSKGIPGFLLPYVLKQATTDRDGRVALADLHRGRLPVEVDAPGVGVVTGHWIDVPHAHEYVIALGAANGVTVHGLVQNVDGGPIKGAHVVVTSTVSRMAETHRTTARVATTDDTGTWRVQHLPPGSIAGIAFAAQGFVTLAGVESQRPIAAGDDVETRVVLVATGSVAGRVLGPDGRPVRSASVQVGRRHARTDELGAFRVDGVSPGAREVRVAFEGLLLARSPSVDPGSRSAGVWAQVDSGKITRIPDLRLTAGIVVSGAVVDRKGTPVPDAWVRMSSRTAGEGWDEPGSTIVACHSRSDGSFVFPPVPPADDWHLFARADARDSSPHREVTLRAEGRVVVARVVVVAQCQLAGQVQDEQGQPAPGVGLELAGPSNRTATTDSNGRFAFRELSEGTYSLTPTYAQRRNRAKPHLVRMLHAGDQVDDVVFQFDPPRTIEGFVRDERGEPAPGVLVELKADEPFEFADRWQTEETRWGWGVSTNDKGQFTIEDVAPGGYFIRPARDQAASYVKAGEAGVRLVWYRDRLPAADGPMVDRMNRWTFQGARLPLEGRVLDAAGNPVAAGRVKVTSTGSHSYESSRTTLFNFGVYRTTVPSDAKSIDVEIFATTDAAGKPLALKAAKRTGLDVRVGRVDFQLEQAPWTLRSITGRVVDSTGAPVWGVLVRATQATQRKESFPSSVSAATTSDGTFRIDHLMEGEYDLVIRPGGDLVPFRKTVEAGATEVALTVDRAKWISGRVVDVAGRALWGIRVNADDEECLTSFDGTFRLGPIAGNTTVVVPWSETRNSVQSNYVEYDDASVADVAPGTTDLRIVLQRVTGISGQVLDADGGVVPDATILLEPIPADDGREVYRTEQAWHGDAFSFEKVPLGRWRISATDEDGRRTSRPVEVEAPAKGVRLVVEDQPAIRGKLVGADASGFRIRISRGDRATREHVVVWSDEDGTFVWNTDDARPCSLFANRDGDDRYALVASVEPGSATVALRLQVGARIEGTLAGVGDAVAAVHMAVWARSDRGHLVYAAVASDRSFTFRGLPPGEVWTLVAHAASGNRMYRGTVRNVQSGARDVTLILPSK